VRDSHFPQPPTGPYDDVALEQLPNPSSEEAQAIVTTDTDAPSVPYSPMLFGGFIEHFDGQICGGLFEPGSPLSDERGFRKDVIAALKELKLSIVRWPGGCFATAIIGGTASGRPASQFQTRSGASRTRIRLAPMNSSSGAGLWVVNPIYARMPETAHLRR
jgi:hypothetical protein